MKKGGAMKKLICFMITAIMVITMLAGIVSAEEPALDRSWPEETIKIGVEVYDTSDDTVVGYETYFNYLAEYYNLEFIFSESIASAEDELAFIENCGSAGCKGFISGYNVSRDTSIKRATELGMYYWGVDRDLDAEFADNEYYLGGFLPVVDGSDAEGNGDYLLGYELAYTLVAGGSQHIAFCNGGADLGVPFFIDRQEGFFAGIEQAKADGYEFVFDPETDVVSGFPGTDEFAARQSQIINGDYDAIGVSFSGALVWLQPIIDAGKMGQVKLAGVGVVDETVADLSESGTIGAMVYECEEIIFGNAVAMIINAVNGHADLVKGEEGFLAIPTNRWTVVEADDFKAIAQKHAAGEYYITAEDLVQFFPEFNPDTTRDEFIEFYRSKTLANTVTK